MDFENIYRKKRVREKERKEKEKKKKPYLVAFQNRLVDCVGMTVPES